MVSGPLSITIPVCILILCSGTCEGKKKNEDEDISKLHNNFVSTKNEPTLSIMATQKVLFIMIIVAICVNLYQVEGTVDNVRSQSKGIQSGRISISGRRGGIINTGPRPRPRPRPNPGRRQG
uniref:Uncharacterized protein n=1 Tax=Magallana gigas TaxID=29159 RepID=A0A8W8NZU4_MAGGI